MYFKKFYTPEPDFSGATVDNVRIVSTSAAPAIVTETVTAPPAEPTIIKEPAAEPPAEVVPQETTPVVEPQAPASVPPVTSQEPAAPVAAKNWKDILKENGADDDVINLVDYRFKNGNIKPYLEAVSTDFKSMSPEDIMKRELKERYPTLSPQHLEKLYQKESIEKYNLDSDDPDEVEFGRALMSVEAEQKRTKFIERQQAFLVTDKDPLAEIQRRQAQEAEAHLAEQQNALRQIKESPVVKDLMKDKKLKIPLSDTANFFYAVPDPEKHLEVFSNAEVYQKLISKVDAAGNFSPDNEKLMLMASVLRDPRGFLKAIHDDGRVAGKEEYIATELQNVQKDQSVTPVPEGLTLQEAFKKHGKRVNW